MFGLQDLLLKVMCMTVVTLNAVAPGVNVGGGNDEAAASASAHPSSLPVSARSNPTAYASTSHQLTGLGNVVGSTLFDLTDVECAAIDAHAHSMRTAQGSHRHPSRHASMGGWKSASGAANGNAAHYTSMMTSWENDSIMWLKLLFLPSLALLILLCFLLEEYCFASHSASASAAAHAQAQIAAAHQAAAVSNGHARHLQQQQQKKRSLFGWLRSCCKRAPRLTTAYRAQMQQQNAAALALSHGHNGTNAGTCACCAARMHASSASGLHSASPSSSSLLPSGIGAASPSTHSSPFTSAPLTLEFNGFNHMRGALEYYDVFKVGETACANNKLNLTDPLSKPTKQHKSSKDTDADVNQKSNKFTNGTTTNHVNATTTNSSSSKKKRQKQMKQGGSSDAQPTTVVITPSSPTPAPSSPSSSSSTSPTPTSPSPTSSSSSSLSLPPPSSEMMSISLINSSTGFHRTFRIWCHLTFGEILMWYIENWWQDERSKYEGYEGGSTSNSDSNNSTPANSDGADTDDEDDDADEPKPKRPPRNAPPLMLRYQGARISPFLTPASVFPQSSNGASHTDASDKESVSSPSSSSSSRSSSVASNPSSPSSTSRSTSPRLKAKSKSKSPIPSTPSSPASSTRSSKSRSSSSAQQQPESDLLSLPPADAMSVPVLEVCIDYLVLFDRLRQRSSARLTAMQANISSSQELQTKMADEVARTDKEIECLSKSYKEVSDKLNGMNNELKRVSKENDRVSKELSSLESKRRALEASISSSVGIIGQLKAALEAEYLQLKSQHAEAVEAFQARKARYQALLETRQNLAIKLKKAMVEHEQRERKLNTIKQHKAKHDKVSEKIRKLEQVLGPATPSNTDAASTTSTSSSSSSTSSTSSSSTSTTSSSSTPTPSGVDASAPASVRMKQRYEQLESEHNILNAHLNQLRVRSHELDDVSKSELSKVRHRVKALEKDMRELNKWKNVARQHEQEARECVRWKIIVRQQRQKERERGGGDRDSRGGDKSERESVQWKMRARAMEKEVRELRQWKRNLDAASAVMGFTLPPYDPTATAPLIDDYDELPSTLHTLNTAVPLSSGDALRSTLHADGVLGPTISMQHPSHNETDALAAALASYHASTQSSQLAGLHTSAFQTSHHHHPMQLRPHLRTDSGDDDLAALHSSFDMDDAAAFGADGVGSSTGAGTSTSVSFSSFNSTWGQFGSMGSSSGSGMGVGVGLSGTAGSFATAAPSQSYSFDSAALASGSEVAAAASIDADTDFGNLPALAFLSGE